ncbi:MAG: hypothetical protein ACREK5_06420 [Gemmatimonadota bacterium]
MSTGQLLRVRDEVQAAGPVHCSQLVVVKGEKRMCYSLIGAPAVGSKLVEIEEGGWIERCGPLSSYRCRCGAVYRFAPPGGLTQGRVSCEIRLHSISTTRHTRDVEPAGAWPEESPRVVARRALSL